jgi:hypothetical protein
MEKLQNELNRLIERLEHAEDFRASLQNLVSVYPFSEYEYIISHLLSAGKLTIDEYYDLRNSYKDRNPNLELFQKSARKLGDTWAFAHLKEKIPEIKKPSKEIDPEYSKASYDLLLGWEDENQEKHHIRVEVKTARALDKEKPEEPLYVKALASDSNGPFDLIFEQIKPKFADVFILIGVWRDKIRYWVLNRDEVEGNKYFSKGQHRGNIGEGQLHLTDRNIHDFKQYEVESTAIKQAIIGAYKRLHNLT